MSPKQNTQLPDPAHEFEIVRRIARYHLHQGALLLSDITWAVPFKRRPLVTDIVGQINVIEQQLSDLAPQ